METNLNTIRKRLDSIDNKLLKLIAERQAYMAQVGKYKLAHKLPINQPTREREILEAKKKQARGTGLDPKLVETVWKTFFKNAKDIQRKLK